MTTDDALHFNDTFTYFHSFNAHNGSSLGHFLKEGIITRNVHSFMYTFTHSTFKDPNYVSSHRAENRQNFSLKILRVVDKTRYINI